MNNFRELNQLKQLSKVKDPIVNWQTLDHIDFQGREFPIKALTIGKNDPNLPTLGLFAGVHGLENIGSQVLLNYLSSLIEQLKWDKDLRKKFKTFRIVSIPIVNPVGMFNQTRSNGNGVDLMRNSPVRSKVANVSIMSGHQLSSVLPWYQGDINNMEKESQILTDFVKDQMYESKLSVAIDFHSGFGIRDRLWYPYAYSKKKYFHLKHVKKVIKLLDKSFPYHVYKIEPQSASYTTHGDLWDHLCKMHEEKFADKKVFIPWTLEMGSWSWIRKNPKQLFSKVGLFHPIERHRQNRVLRRHIYLIEFFSRILCNHKTLLKL